MPQQDDDGAVGEARRRNRQRLQHDDRRHDERGIVRRRMEVPIEGDRDAVPDEAQRKPDANRTPPPLLVRRSLREIALPPEIDAEQEDSEHARAEDHEERVGGGPLTRASDEHLAKRSLLVGANRLLNFARLVWRQRRAEERRDVVADEQHDDEPVEEVTPDEQRALRHRAERHQEQAADRIGDQDVAPPEQERVGEPLLQSAMLPPIPNAWIDLFFQLSPALVEHLHVDLILTLRAVILNLIFNQFLFNQPTICYFYFSVKTVIFMSQLLNHIMFKNNTIFHHNFALLILFLI